jgi:transcriptional regulator with XRE-family HTH domain
MSKVSRQKKKDNTIIINRLAIVLKEERMTNRALALQLGYEEATVSKWATNAIQPPISTFFRIALTINRDLQDFFISTKGISEADKERYLKILAKVAERGKRTGKSKE